MARSALIETDQLAASLRAPDLRLVDATWFMPDSGRDAKAEFGQCHLPGAVYFDIDDISDENSPLPHTFPSPAKFSSRVRDLGLGDGSQIVVYDNNSYFASARVWWMFRVMGHDDIAVLNGGLKKWVAEGREIDDIADRPQQRHFTARQNNLLIRDLDQMRSNLTARRDQVVDARSAERFTGSVPEPRPGLRAGHIPGSRNLHYAQLLKQDGCFKEPAALKTILEASGLDLARPIVTTCGSGVSAALINIALYEAGVSEAAMYDGSWTEWGSQPDTPVER